MIFHKNQSITVIKALRFLYITVEGTNKNTFLKNKITHKQSTNNETPKVSKNRDKLVKE